MVAHTRGIFEVTFAVRQKSPNAEFFQIRIQSIMNTFLDTFHGVLWEWSFSL